MSTGGYVYHIINRGVGRMTLFESDDDYAAFEQVLAEAVERTPGIRLLGYCIMPDHWHLMAWPRGDGDLSEFMRWLTVTHTQRWHAHHHSSGTGPIYQGRFKSFPTHKDDHFYTVMRYVERNAKRANLVRKAEAWRWGSLWRWVNRQGPAGRVADLPELSTWPIARPRAWTTHVNTALTNSELDAVRRCITRSAPYGSDAWTKRIAAKLGLESSLRPIGRPKKVE